MTIGKYDDVYHPPHTVDGKLDALIVLIKELNHEMQRLFTISFRKEQHMSTQLDHLQAAFTKLSGDVDTAVTEIKDLAQKLADAIANGSDPAAIESVASGLDALAGRLEAVQVQPPVSAGS